MASTSSTLLLRSLPAHTRRPVPFPTTGVPLSAASRVPSRRLPLLMSTAPGPAAGAGEDKKSPDDPLVQYVVLRRDLIDAWPLGSVVTQGCHAAVAAVWAHKDDPHTREYCGEANLDRMHKVTLEVKGADQVKNLADKLGAGGIAHKLWIEQPEDIPTCLATKPYPKSVVSVFFRKLKLCK